MTSIKPPGNGPLQPHGTDSSPGLAPSEQSGFKAHVPSGAPAPRSESASRTGAVIAANIGAVGEDLRAKRITRAEAIERVVSGSMEQLGAALTGGGRAELTERLRSALEHDPTLQALLGDLENGR